MKNRKPKNYSPETLFLRAVACSLVDKPDYPYQLKRIPIGATQKFAEVTGYPITTSRQLLGSKRKPRITLIKSLAILYPDIYKNTLGDQDDE